MKPRTVDGDSKGSWPVLSHRELGHGYVSSFVEDVVLTPLSEQITRQYTTHPGAVAIVAWDRQADTIATVRQYRHPVGFTLLEIPAGLLDHPDEPHVEAAKRELAEECSLEAKRWDTLVDIFTSPGASQEALRIFLAQDPAPTGSVDGFVAEGEEAVMVYQQVPRAELLRLIFAGEIQNPSMVAGLLALETSRLTSRLDDLRPPDAPWPAKV